MDSNDFIFSDDVAESLGFRMERAAKDPFPAGHGEAAAGSVKSNLVALGGLGLGIAGFLSHLGEKASL